MSQRKPLPVGPGGWRAASLRSLAVAVVIIASALSSSAAAFKFTPFSQDFEPAGSKASHTFYVTNDGDTAIAVEITIRHRAMAADGSDSLDDAEDDFVLFPSQIVLPAGQRQAVRVQYIGSPGIDTEKAYRIIAEQLPIDLDSEAKTGVNIDFLLRYVGAIYVVPSGAVGRIEVGTAEIRKSGAGRELALTLRNEGNAHVILRDASMKVVDPRGGTFELTGDALGEVQSGNVLARAERTFIIPVAPGLPTGAARVDLDFIPSR